MSFVLSTIAPTETKTQRKSALPLFHALALAGFSANALFIAISLLIGWTHLAASLLGGYVLALVVYGLLYLVVTQGFSGPRSPGKRLPLGFALLMIIKSFVIGAVMFVLLWVLHLAAVWLLVGFLIAQAGVTAAVMKHMKNTKVTD